MMLPAESGTLPHRPWTTMSLVNGRTRKRSAAGGWSEAEVCAEEVADPRKPMRLQRGRICRSAGVLRGVLPLRSAVHCCRCEALDLTEREQTHKKRMTIAVTPIPKKSTGYQPSG